MSRIKTKITTVLLIILALLMLFPLILTVTNSFMPSQEITDNYSSYDEEAKGKFFSIKLIPSSVTLRQYYDVLIAKHKFLRMFWNSVFVVLPIVAGQVIISSMAAFVFAKLKFKGRDFL